MEKNDTYVYTYMHVCTDTFVFCPFIHTDANILIYKANKTQHNGHYISIFIQVLFVICVYNSKHIRSAWHKYAPPPLLPSQIHLCIYMYPILPFRGFFFPSMNLSFMCVHSWTCAECCLKCNTHETDECQLSGAFDNSEDRANCENTWPALKCTGFHHRFKRRETGFKPGVRIVQYFFFFFRDER